MKKQTNLILVVIIIALVMMAFLGLISGKNINPNANQTYTGTTLSKAEKLLGYKLPKRKFLTNKTFRSIIT